MKCDKCGYDDNGSGDTAHACTFYQSLSQPVKTPQRTRVNATTWRGLTDEEIEEIFNKSAGYGRDDFRSFAKAIEAKLKAKNERLPTGFKEKNTHE